MTKFTLPEGVFPDSKLSTAQKRDLKYEADAVVRETLTVNEAFLADGGRMRSPEWRLVRSKEGLNVYRHRATSGASLKSLGARWHDPSSPLHEPLTPSWKTRYSRVGSKFTLARKTELGSADVTEFSIQSMLSTTSEATKSGVVESMRRPGVPLMALHGLVDGTLADTMFGCFAASDKDWRWRSSHINDRFDDARILATVRQPSRNDPLRFLGLKWFAKEHPAVLSGIVHQRDFVIMEATGHTQDSHGNKVGYFLMHSVTMPNIAPQLSELGVIRGALSFCFLVRQHGPSSVELYCRGFSDPRGDMMERVSVAITAESLLGVASVVDYAYIKKLTWFMQHRDSKSVVNSSSLRRELSVPRRDSRCEFCSKPFTTFSLLAIAQGNATVGHGASCQICRRTMCAKCSVMKKMTVDVTTSREVTQISLRFCHACLLEAKEYPAWSMALDSIGAHSSSSSMTPSPIPSSSASSSMGARTPSAGPRTPSPKARTPPAKDRTRATSTLPSPPQPLQPATSSRKLVYIDCQRSYSEYQRGADVVVEDVDMVADSTHADPEERPRQKSHGSSNCRHSGSDRYHTATKERPHGGLPNPASAMPTRKAPMPAPPLATGPSKLAGGHDGIRMRSSERPKSSRAVGFQAL